jgi:L-asparagine transporter-like permease
VAFGPAIGFEVGWLLWLARVTAFAALSNLLLGYLSYFWPAAGSGWMRAAILTTVAVTLTIVNLAGVRQSALVSNLFVIGKLTPLLLFVIAGLFFLDPQPFTLRAAPSYGSFSTAVLLVFAFSGMEIAVPAGERDPRRHIHRAADGHRRSRAALCDVQVICISTLPELANSSGWLMQAVASSSRSVDSSGWGSFCCRNAQLSGARRLAHSCNGRARPASGGACVNTPSVPPPYIAILVSGAVMLTALQGTFMSALTISTVIRLFSYIATCIALPVLREKRRAAPRFRCLRAAVAFAATMLALWGTLEQLIEGRPQRGPGGGDGAGLVSEEQEELLRTSPRNTRPSAQGGQARPTNFPATHLRPPCRGRAYPCARHPSGAGNRRVSWFKSKQER